MSNAKVKITIKPRKSDGSGTAIAVVPVSVEERRSGKMFYQTKAKITVSPKRTANGEPRPKRKPRKAR